eukprot:2404912-Rhodomonas_salina.1
MLADLSEIAVALFSSHSLLLAPSLDPDSSEELRGRESQRKIKNRIISEEGEEETGRRALICTRDGETWRLG